MNNDGSELVGGLNPSGNGQAIKVDANGNLLTSTKGGFTELAGLSAAALNADLVPATDVAGYRWASLHVNSSAFSGTLTIQGSNDNSSWVTVNAGQVFNSIGITTTVNSPNSIVAIPLSFRYLRVRMTSYSSGTAQAVLELYTTISQILSSGVQAQQFGTWSLGASTSGGTNDFHLVSAASNNATNIKNSAGQVYGYEIYNTNAAVRFVKLYNKSSAPNPASDSPFRTIAVPAGGRAHFHSTTGLALGNGISLATVTGISDTDNTSVGAGDLVIDIDWK